MVASALRMRSGGASPFLADAARISLSAAAAWPDILLPGIASEAASLSVMSGRTDVPR